MSSDDPKTTTPSAVTVKPVGTVATPVAESDLLAVSPTNAPVLAEPEMLVEGLRYLQRRIPEFTHLSWQEKRTHARAASLDPEFVESGIQAAAVWRDTKMVVGRGGEELQQEQEEIRHWEKVIVEMRALLDGIEAANLKRKHRLGSAILQIYRMVGIYLRGSDPGDIPMRPYYENMQRAYRRTKQFRKRRKKDEPAE